MLDEHETEVNEERNSRKQPLTDDEARALIASVSTLRVAKGRKIRELAAGEAGLDDLKGPTGNYRAPIVRAGGELLVGFNPEALQQLLGA